MSSTELEIADWRRRVQALYAAVREEPDPRRGHHTWQVGRDELFRDHPQSPLPNDHPLRDSGLRYWPYDPGLRFELPLVHYADGQPHVVESDSDEATVLRAIGKVDIPAPVDITLTVWWAQQYGGGVFLPVRDQTAGTTTYGGGRYLLDSVKGADLGGSLATIVIDLNFLYHPSCCYSDKWKCPLAPAENTVEIPLCAGERLI
ncbi:MAG TPA: DUF1684 domain-containing protein [Acidimicrobiales bacterium]|nr:DUF1684 domain-containing protein [Acidimicrobiales bacterium]